MNTLRKIAENFNKNIQILYDEPMSEHTTFKVGGKADVFFEPHTIEELEQIAACLKENSQSFFVLGGGSNLVVSDAGISRAVISTQKLNQISLTGTADAAVSDNADNAESLLLKCAAGVLMDNIAAFCESNSISGLETFSGLPGTIGGAVYMNARCYERSISDVLESVLYLDTKTGKTTTYQFNGKDWAYKKSPFQNSGNIILEATLKCAKGNAEQIKAENSRYVEDRKNKGHFKFPSAGSVFKNNHAFGSPSGKIIDEAGLRGFSIGGAQVAPWHGNFIINTGNATAKDIHDLVLYITETVKRKTGFELEPEIIFTGTGFDC
ncbi:MAG: UDP-N-acetylmuramate dehydrogenase [Spirochaetaceae bacterium]|nr:UDP-N-acetylmuramate dehydrogenase [Spirochaetaceae bacterium]